MPISAIPLKGTKDHLPQDFELRHYVETTIFQTYRRAGFQRISTPILEASETLKKSEGGENLNMIFQVLKRGQKLDLENALSADDLVDCGLRYDLTLPLSRFIAHNSASLSFPFKCIQIDRVFRAERPQQDRLREFVQCDIDIIGDSSCAAEIELIDTTATALLTLGLSDFSIRINDRRILSALILKSGFAEEDVPSVSITFDKLDKIGYEGIADELREKGFPEAAIAALVHNIGTFGSLENLEGLADDQVFGDLRCVIEAVDELSKGRYKIEYDPSLVRGMGYYTGMIFEIVADRSSSSVGGGGRYDNMIGKFTKESIPAVGFSIGFERIVGILKKQQDLLPPAAQKCAVLYDAESSVCDVIETARQMREADPACVVSIEKKKKKIGKQYDALEKAGYTSVYLFEEGMHKPLG